MDPLSRCWKSLDTPRWYVFHFRSRPRETWQEAMVRMFKTIEHAPIDLRVTRTTLTLFRDDDPRPLHVRPNVYNASTTFSYPNHIVSSVQRDPHVKRLPTPTTFEASAASTAIHGPHGYVRGSCAWPPPTYTPSPIFYVGRRRFHHPVKTSFTR